jgi:DNA-directed RNA polymerase subunit RPC12/RpoP
MRTFIITKKARPLVCQRCGHPWNYTGSNEYIASCPHCQTKVSLRKRQQIDNHEEKSTSKKPLRTTAKVGHQVEQSPIVEAKTTRREGSMLSHG